MITLPLYQIPLAGVIALLVLRDIRARNLFSACVLAMLLAYCAYLLAIDWTEQIEQVRVFSHLSPRFVATNCTILATFTVCFMAGRVAARLLWRNTPLSPPPPTAPGILGGAVLAPLFLGTALVVVSGDGWWLFARYPQNKGAFALFDLGGASAVANLLILIALHRAHSLNQHLGLARVTFWLIAAHYLLAGDRGAFLFLVVGGYAYRMLSLRRFDLRICMELALAVTGLLLVLDQVSYLRSWGMDAGGTGGTFLEEIDLLPQSIAHMSHAIDIANAGHMPFEDGLPAFMGTLLVQVIPSKVLGLAGIETYNGPLLLKDYVAHGGGFFVPAELFFIGGLGGVAALALWFGVVAALNDRIAHRAAVRQDSLMLTVVLIAAAGNCYTMFYGVQAFHRMLTLPLVFLLARNALLALAGPEPTVHRIGP